MSSKPTKSTTPNTFRFITDLNKLNFKLNPTLKSISELNKNIQKTYSPLLLFSQSLQKQFSPFYKTINSIDWKSFEKAYRLSMIKEFSGLRDERITAILGQVLSEFWLNLFIKTLFSNSKKIQEMSFDNKRKILEGLGIINGGLSSDLKLLDDIRAEYAHNFNADKDKVLKILDKINRYKNLIKNKKLKTNNGNNVRIRKTALEIIKDLMDIEEKYVIEVQKITKTKMKTK